MKIKYKNVLIIMIIVLILTPMISLANNLEITVDENNLIQIHKDKANQPKIWNEFIEKYRILIVGLSGLGALTSLLFFMKSFIALSTSGSHPMQRTLAIKGLLWTGISTALLGATGLITAITYGIFR